MADFSSSNPQAQTLIARRTFLRRTGLGSISLASLMNPTLGRSAATSPVDGSASPTHHPPRIKRVIHLCMAGGPSHLETFDFKPELVKHDGKPMPESLTKGQPIAQLQGAALVARGPQLPFSKRGECGLEMATIFEHMGNHADEMCVIKSMHTEQINHDPAHTFFNTGTAISGRPSMGSWVLYGLGAETRDLPGFIVLTSEGGAQGQPISSRQWHSGFLPSRFQGVQMHSTGSPVHYVGNPDGVGRQQQRDIIDAVSRINSIRNRELDDPEVATRITGYEMAFRMQASVPKLTDMSDEPKHIIDMYGCKPGDGSFASRDFHATLLHLLGIDHNRFSYKFQGLDFRLTGVEEAHVLHDVLT
jgi:hypothetical protein